MSDDEQSPERTSVRMRLRAFNVSAAAGFYTASFRINSSIPNVFSTRPVFMP